MDVFEFIDDLIKRIQKKIEEHGPIEHYSTETVDDIDDIVGFEEYLEVLYDKTELVEQEKDNVIKKVEKDFKRSHARHGVAVIDMRQVVLEAVIRLANEEIDRINEDTKATNKKFKKVVKNLFKIKELLKAERVDLIEVHRLIDDMPIEEMVEYIKKTLLESIDIYAVNKEAAYIEKQEAYKQELLEKQKASSEKIEKITTPVVVKRKLIEINNYDLVEPILIDDYETLRVILGNPVLTSELTIEDINDICEWPFTSMKYEDYKSIILSILSLINDYVDMEESNPLIGYLEIMVNKLEISNFYKEVYKKSLDICAINGITEAELTTIIDIQKQLQAIHNSDMNDNDVYELLDNFDNTLNNIINKRKIKKTTDDSKIKLKGFVLFDYKLDDCGRLIPYITSDLDPSSPKSCIDVSVNKEKLISNGYQDFNDLVDDILLSGDPRILTELTNDKINRCVRPVYKTTNAYELINTSYKNSTGMIRIRPRRTSLVRFIDEKIVIKPENKNYAQIKELLESKFKNVEFDDTFNIYINYLTAFKCKDTDSYITSTRRQESSILKSLLEDRVLSQNELDTLSEAIDSSISAYDELCNMNENFSFKAMNMIKEGDTRK